MHHPLTRFVAAPCGALLAAVPVSLEGPIVFQPAEGASVERTYTWTEAMETTDLEFTQDGEEAVDAPRAESTVRRERTLGVVDTYVRSAPNQPLELVRKYDDTTEESEGKLVLSTWNGDAELPLSAAGTSELEGVGVRFVWDAEEEAWEKTYADDYEGREELLEPLEVTHDFIALLPDAGKDVEPGDEWDVDAAAIAAILRPGGALPLEIESDLAAVEGALDPTLLPGVLDTLVGETDGEITATLESIEDGVAKIVFEVDVTITSDQGEALEQVLEDAVPDDVTAELTAADYTTKLEGKGELLWDMAAGRAASLSLEFDAEMEISSSIEVDAGGTVIVFELNETRTGTIALVVE